MNKNYGYKYFGIFCEVFLLGVSLSFAFIWPDACNGNAAYWVMKSIALLFIVVNIVAICVSKAAFSKVFPLTGLTLLVQGLPALMRIGWVKNHTVAPWLVLIDVILMFLFVAPYVLMMLSHNQFRDSEKQAKHSSNYKGPENN